MGRALPTRLVVCFSPLSNKFLLHLTRCDHLGTFLRVYGSLNTMGLEPPQWSCSVDGKLLASSPPVGPNQRTNHWVLCEVSPLPPAQHTLTIKPSFNSTGSIFWLDYILYTPLPSEQLKSTTVQVENDDEDISYTGPWEQSDGIVTQTSTPEAKCNFVFNGNIPFLRSCFSLISLLGTSVSLIGRLSPGESNEASFSIDGGSSTTFVLTPSVDPNGTSSFLSFYTLFYPSQPYR
jgi:hypothetical protein